MKQIPRALLVAAAAVFPRFPDDVRKVAAAQRLFGRAGVALLPFLNRGPEGLGDSILQARDHGLTVIL